MFNLFWRAEKNCLVRHTYPYYSGMKKQTGPLNKDEKRKEGKIERLLWKRIEKGLD